MSLRLNSTGGKLFASGALLAAAAGAAGLGTFGSFTSSTSASATVASGTVQIALGAAGSAANRLTVGASGLVPGDSVQRAVTVSNTGDQGLASVTLASAASPSSKLDTDPTNGLQLSVQSCSNGWVEGGTAPAYTYTCTGTKTTLGSGAVAASYTLAGLNSLAASGSDSLLVTLALPASADNSFQGLSSTLTFTFTGLQRAGTSK